MQAYVPAADAAAFDRSRARLETVIGWLADAATGEVGHAEVEQRLQAEARGVFRQLLQDHLDLRAVREQPVAAVTGRDGITRRYVEADHNWGLVTVFGKVTVRRLAYRAKGAANLYPADAVLDLPAGLHSHGLARLAAIESARGSFAAAQQAIERGGISRSLTRSRACHRGTSRQTAGHGAGGAGSRRRAGLLHHPRGARGGTR